MKAAVIGSGAWGTALAVALAKNGHQVIIWTFEKALIFPSKKFLKTILFRPQEMHHFFPIICPPPYKEVVVHKPTV